MARSLLVQPLLNDLRSGHHQAEAMGLRIVPWTGQVDNAEKGVGRGIKNRGCGTDPLVNALAEMLGGKDLYGLTGL